LFDIYCHRISIHSEFPKDILIDIMKPYLYLYLINNYHIYGTEKREKCFKLLKIKMKEFYKFNPGFGRKYITTTTDFITGKLKTIISYNIKHPSFTMSDIKKINYINNPSMNRITIFNYSPFIHSNTVINYQYNNDSENENEVDSDIDEEYDSY